MQSFLRGRKANNAPQPSSSETAVRSAFIAAVVRLAAVAKPSQNATSLLTARSTREASEALAACSVEFTTTRDAAFKLMRVVGDVHALLCSVEASTPSGAAYYDGRDILHNACRRDYVLSEVTLLRVIASLQGLF